MKRSSKALLYACLSVLGLGLLVPVSFYFFLRHEYHLPPERRVREQLASNRADYIRLVTLLKEYDTGRFIDISGDVDLGGLQTRQVPEYRHLIRKIGAKDVLMREDGSIEFTLWGFGCAVCSDSYMGVRYVPKDHKRDSPAGWEQTLVTSLDSAKLPQEKGAVATGLYVVPIEPE